MAKKKALVKQNNELMKLANNYTGYEDVSQTDLSIPFLKIAQKKRMKDITFPAISTGIFCFPLQKCSEIMLKVAMDFIEKNDFPHEIIFCLYQNKSFSIFEKTFTDLIKNKESRD